MFETIINELCVVENGGIGQKEHSSPFSFGNMVILPLSPVSGGIGTRFGAPWAKFRVNQ